LELGWSHFFRGELQQAREHLERVLELYDHERHSSHAFIYGDNPATSARSCLAEVLWLLGHVDQARRRSQENLTILRSFVEHPYSVAFGLDIAAFLRQYLRDPQTAGVPDRTHPARDTGSRARGQAATAPCRSQPPKRHGVVDGCPVHSLPGARAGSDLTAAI
jgi:hypothetical protein